MIYVFLGNNKLEIKKEIKNLHSQFSPSSEMFIEIDSLSWNSQEIETFLFNPSLSGEFAFVVLRFVFEDQEAQSFIEKRFDDFKKSKAVFVLIEETVPQKTLNLFKNSSVTVKKLLKKDENSKLKNNFNVFSISEAVGLKDRKKAWVLYQEAQKMDIAPEEILPILSWQIKTMLLAESSKSLEESGLKPFVYTKAKKYVQNYSREELITLSKKLTDVYKNSRGGKGEVGILIEKIILNL